MSTNITLRLSLVAIALGGLVAACGSSDSNPTPNPVGSSSSSTTTSSSSTSGGGNTSSSSTSTTSSGMGGMGGAGGGGGCFKGMPMTNDEFLNACTGAQCSPFTTKLPLLNPDGSLPALP
jgi:hypothetical protein